MRVHALLLALLFAPACGSSSSAAPAAPADSTASAVQAAPAAAQPAPELPPVDTSGASEVTGDCALEIHTDGAWVRRDAVACSDELALLVAGDIGRPGPILEGTVAGAAAWCRERRCDLGLLPGDVLYGDGQLAEAVWGAVWDDGFASLGVPFLVALGNHEYRHEPNPHLKRAALLAADGRARLVSHASSYAVRVVRNGEPLVALAVVDTDSIANPGPGMPGLGSAALDAACALDVPTVWVGHHPPSSQGVHHTHEAHVETALRAELRKRVADGCRVVVATAGHDHDLQAYGPGCEEDGVPGIVVAGPGGKGFRPPGPLHLTPCPQGDAIPSRYHAGPKAAGGFARVTVQGTTGAVAVELVETTLDGQATLLSAADWTP